MAKPFKMLDASQGRPRLDRYELIAELAAGGMATVFLARLSGAGGFQRFVAIKRLHPHLAHEAEFVEMFLDEARLAASIHHPNVVPILEVGETPAGYYLVMEYIEGDTLWNLRNLATDTKPGGKLPPPVAVRIIHDALLGLHAAHELRDEEGRPLNVVHRDVSPQNILVGTDGTARLTDFGVARAATRLSSTRSGEVKGKLAYMAPEQVRGEEIDRRSDLFAMGIVLWEALASKHLFLGPSEAATMHRVMNEPVPVLYTIAPGIPKKLSDIVARALDRNPDQRFPTCLEMAEAIESAVRGVMPLPPAREVAAVVDTLVGQRIADRKEAITQWLASSQSTLGGTGAWPAERLNGPPSVRTGPASGAGPLPMVTPPPRPPPSEPAPVGSLTTGSSLSPLLAGTTAPPGVSSQHDPAAASPSRRALLVVAPAALLVALGVGWVAARGSGKPAVDESPASTGAPSQPQPSASVAPAASPAASPAATAPPVVESAPPVASSAPTPTVAPKTKATSVTHKATATPTPGGLDQSPYR